VSGPGRDRHQLRERRWAALDILALAGASPDTALAVGPTDPAALKAKQQQESWVKVIDELVGGRAERPTAFEVNAARSASRRRRRPSGPLAAVGRPRRVSPSER
jgi:hypothetical protein